MRDPAVASLVPLVKLEPVQDQPPYRAYLDVTLDNGEHVKAHTDIVMGHPDNPMSWDALRAKFEGLVEPIMGKTKTAELFEAARGFGPPGSLKRLSDLLAGPEA